MDLSALDNITTGTCELAIYGPDGEPLTYDDNGTESPCTITVVSADSADYQRVFKRQVTAKSRDMQKRGRAKITGDSVESDKIELLVACTKGWKGFVMGDQPFPFTQANATRLYTQYPIIREQVEAGITDRGNFVQKS